MDVHGMTDRVAWTFWREDVGHEEPMYVWSVNADRADDCCAGMCRDPDVAIEILCCAAARLAGRPSETDAVLESIHG